MGSSQSTQKGPVLHQRYTVTCKSNGEAHFQFLNPSGRSDLPGRYRFVASVNVDSVRIHGIMVNGDETRNNFRMSIDQVESPSNRAPTNHISQSEHRPGTFSYTGLISLNGSFGDQFWLENDGGHGGDDIAHSKEWSTTANKSTESGSKDVGTKSQGNENKVGEGVKTK
ncbi:MAG: hypothetical protein ASARMPREDX12_001592 [Alectoria sarmentosa]|nr:MAG: hypothetical protein ASARMPREDX12_001592 [Alectoria sarmentosa]